MKTIAVMGSTGSIGTQTLDIVRVRRDLKVCALSAGKNIELIEKQAREFLPELVVIENEADADILKYRLSDLNIKVMSGMEGLIALAEIESSDIFVGAIVGMIGIRPTIHAIKAGKDIALANKETLVTAGHIIMPLVKQYGVKLIPVDSEHSAIFQCLQGSPVDENGGRSIYKIWLTASGGTFRGKKTDELRNMKAKDALVNPNWSMGDKVTIDSASLVNKGLEVMEAHWLFDTDFDDINVILQPQSIIHSMVEFNDGAVIAQLGTPDMHLPIQYALLYPKREDIDSKRLDFTTLRSIVFEEPDINTFKGLPLAYEAGRCGGSMPTVFNAANEAAVAKFMRGSIGFLDIYDIIESSMQRHSLISGPSLEEILETELKTREYIESRWKD
ncbi:MAG: 1-deoxy-D-xylulose-5-phosphate reductoisomerase [Lachnospiraceae bacterium]|nr:1-deoxy-D-xylulose-5-phosphate reductoisomerase [Lachnospiraceae bacterium]MDY6222503.1 1-deoxy-D-xylulose-5-phosphate reductoisomerase [Candidatus Alectryocaccobium sp.]